MAMKVVHSSLPDDTLFNEAQAARYLNLSPRTLAQWRARDLGPPWIRVSARVIRYQRQTLREWLESRTLRPTAQA